MPLPLVSAGHGLQASHLRCCTSWPAASTTPAAQTLPTTSSPGGTIVVRTLVDIDADQEICISYLDPCSLIPCERSIPYILSNLSFLIHHAWQFSL